MESKVYLSQCSFEGNGEISTEDGDEVYQLTTLHQRPLPFWFCTYGLLRDPGCSLTGKGEPLMVARERQFPLPRFVITRGNEMVCTISQRSLFLNSYSLNFSRGATWVFQMPLFSAHFQGISDRGGTVEVREWTKREWFIRIPLSQDDFPLIYALAFLHRERLRSA